MPSTPIRGYLERHEHTLQRLIHQANIPAPSIKQATQYALFPGGKRLRPLLVYLCGELVGALPESLDYIAAAIEITHCYSLIHDDLPSMDNDDFRRGKPSCHQEFGEATAILAGDGMQAWAIEILLTNLPNTLQPSQVIAITNLLVSASGPSGMVSGQSLDLSELNATATITQERLSQIHQLKTGKLISACIHMALEAGLPTSEQSRALTQFATHLGLVFQMQDDYLDRYHANQLGKGRTSDLVNQKITFADLYDETQLVTHIQQLYQKTRDALDCFTTRANELRTLIDELCNRF